ncbi:calpain family cysteine protease (macronuclear) [Tetrahymena thermophila SB210]|uniref:Calpain family cysteine protease n=1 Tax=Tetrahymena thermophila (strain SB210) TaxID=312017 RepID=Q23RU4_TETTS|nr:calpain family cysteine protease [Tetrahymena thermophila SB210]EAR99295.2 calpain family cysteine protease [Tetrahymena thermophila SB210]|eukprot:XP_001019540.2 calpain family cysteine protease [Tetrahymena thermophila SB210]
MLVNQLNQTNTSYWEPLSIQIAKDQDLVFISCGVNGIAIVDYLGSKILDTINFNGLYVQNFQVSHNGQILFLSLNSTIQVYKLVFEYKPNDSFKMVEVSMIQAVEFSQIITQMLYVEEVDILIVSGSTGLIASYNTKNKSNLYQTAFYQLDAQQITGLFLSKDFQFLYAGAYQQGMFLFKLNDIADQKNQTNFILAGEGFAGLSTNYCLQTRDYYAYCYDIWTGLYFSNFMYLTQIDESEYPIALNFTYYWPDQTVIPIISSLFLNSAESILFCGVRSYGIYLFDIRSRNKILLIEVIGSDINPFSMQLSKNEIYLYVSTSSNIFSFPQVQVELNDYFPNIFNIHQSSLSELDIIYKPRCYVDFQDEYLFGAFDFNGLYVFPTYKNPYRLNVTSYQNYPINLDTILFDKSGKYIIVPSYYQGILLYIYQYSPLDNSKQQQEISPLNMKLIGQNSYNNTFYSVNMAFSVDKTIAAQAVEKEIIIYNTTDILSIQVLSVWSKPGFLVADIYDLCISLDNRWIIGVTLGQGYFILNISDKNNPILANHQTFQGGFAVVTSAYYNFAYIGEGSKGFAILDTSALPQIKFASRISLTGFTFMVQPIQNEDYILVTQSDKGTLTLIDMRDKYNPIIIYQLLYFNQQAQSVCLCNTLNYLFVTVSDGILTMPYQNEVQIHTEVSEIKTFSNTQQQQKLKYSKQNFGSTNSSRINNEYIFQIGQTVALDFKIIYPQNLNMKVSNIYILQNGNIETLPPQFNFDSKNQNLQIQVTTDLLDKNQMVSNLIIILIKTLIPIDQTSFFYSQEDSYDLAVTNLTQSALIFQSLIHQNVINIDGTLNQNFDVQKKLVLDAQLQKQLVDPSNISDSLYQNIISQITQKVSVTLKKSYSFNPFKFYVISSLKFDNNNRFHYISTNSLQIIQVILKVNSNTGKLIHKNQDSVTFQLSDSQDQLQIEGSQENVNKVLQQYIIFANASEINQNTQQSIQITINDNVNNPLKISINIFECSFIVLKKQLIVNKQLNLQKQLEQQFQNGIIDIESNIAISFSSQSFLVQDTSKITYQAYVQNEKDEFVLIPPSLWLQQQGNDKLNFKGITTSYLYGNVYRFQIQATDGYTKAVDYFTVQVYGIPFVYALNLLLKILGPLLGFFGIYRQRHYFYNIIFQSRVTFSQEEVDCGAKYQKQLIIIENSHEEGMYIVRTLFKKIMENSSFKFQQNQPRAHTHSVSGVQQKNIDNLFENRNSNKEGFQNDFKEFEKFEHQNNFNFKKNTNNIQKVLLNLQKIKKQINKSSLERRYLNEKGSLVLSQAIQDIVSFNIIPKTYKQKTWSQYVNDLTDTNSVLQRIIRALISRYLLKLDQKTHIIYEYIKNYCYQNIQHNKNDWFKAIINIQYKNNPSLKEVDSDINIFPSIDFNYKQLLFIFQQLHKTDNTQTLKIPKSFSQFQKYIETYFQDVNIFLLREVIFADVLGFPQYKPSSFQPSIGKSIYVHSYNISQIIAYKKREVSKHFQPIYRFLNIDYEKYGFSKNMRLPSWLQFDQRNGVIFLYGIPQKQDVEELLIKMYDTNRYVIRQFVLKVNFNILRSDKKQQIDQIYTQQEDSSQLVSSNQQKIFSKLEMPKIISNTFYEKQEDIFQTNSESPSSIFNKRRFEKSLSQNMNLNEIKKKKTEQEGNIFENCESNISEELQSQDVKMFSEFSTHRNSISEKEAQQYLQIILNIKQDEINEL